MATATGTADPPDTLPTSVALACVARDVRGTVPRSTVGSPLTPLPLVTDILEDPAVIVRAETAAGDPVAVSTMIPVAPGSGVTYTAPVEPFTLLTGAPGIHAATLVLVIVGAPVVVLQVAARSKTCVAVGSRVHVELVCSGDSPGVKEAPVPSKMQFAICVAAVPTTVLVVMPQ